MSPSFNYSRRLSSTVSVGNTPLGGSNPIRIQSMTNTSTMDTEACVEQAVRIIQAGGEYVRLTAQGVKEAENLMNIRNGLHALGYQTPLVADIHFNPRAAEAAAAVIEKVRINPGNFVDPVKTFKKADYTEEEYASEIEKIKARFLPFLDICKKHHTAIRIGVNHGSLSDRIMSRYGDTPQGMVESCMEFLRICIAENFNDVVISIKASGTSVMVRTVRLLVDRMNQEGMNFPLHLGVTEAGDGEDGRIKSAVGIGTLLAEGIGDTIRVSLSEDPEKEIPVARFLVDYVTSKAGHDPILASSSPLYNPFEPHRRETTPLGLIGGPQVPVVISDRSSTSDLFFDSQFIPDYVYIGKNRPEDYPADLKLIVDAEVYFPKTNLYPLFTCNDPEVWANHPAEIKFLQLTYSDLTDEWIDRLRREKRTVLLLSSDHIHSLGEQSAAIHRLMNASLPIPVIIQRRYNEQTPEHYFLKASTDCGAFFIDKLADGIMLKTDSLAVPPSQTDICSFGILQAAGSRVSKTEYISCPSCGRTLFNLQSTIRKVKEATHHLKGLKIGIMGCIVNGPGEMADADYGYVGAGPGKINLYKGKICMEKNIPEENAVDRLIQLIKAHGDWKEDYF